MGVLERRFGVFGVSGLGFGVEKLCMAEGLGYHPTAHRQHPGLYYAARTFPSQISRSRDHFLLNLINFSAGVHW